MKESVIETYLCDQIILLGGLCEKHVSPGQRGVPDRLATWPCGMMHLIETKAPGKKPDPHQRRDHERRRKRGVRVFVLDTKEKVDSYIADWKFLT
jgi:hypothetical protein